MLYVLSTATRVLQFISVANQLIDCEFWLNRMRPLIGNLLCISLLASVSIKSGDWKIVTWWHMQIGKLCECGENTSSECCTRFRTEHCQNLIFVEMIYRVN